MRKITLQQHEFARTKDPKLLAFLDKVRTQQPTREELYDFFGTRYLGRNLPAAIDICARGTPEGMPIPIWLTCTNKGSDHINYGYLAKLGYGSRQELENAPDAYPSDPDCNGGLIVVRPGMTMRLTRNLDKELDDDI